MRYYQLFEYNSTQTLINYREPLERRLQTDSRAKDVLGTEPTPETVLRHLEAIDPSKKKAFVLNLLNWYIDGSMRFIEDAYKAKEVFPLYMKFKNRDDVPHISKLSFGEFLDLGDILGETKSNTEIDKEKELVFYESGQAELISDTPEWKVIVPKTEEAAIYFGKNTKWCTSAVNNNAFDRYNKKGPLYIVLFKKENKRYQLHFHGNGQYMNERDEDISIDETIKIFNGPMKNYQKAAVQKSGLFIKYIDNPSEEVQRIAVKKYGLFIKYIDNPSEEVQRIAVQDDSSAARLDAQLKRRMVIGYIRNPSEEVQKLAVQTFGHALQYIENPSEEIQKFAVVSGGYAIRYIKNPSEEVKRLAVQQDGFAIEYINNPSEELKMIAVQQNGMSLRHIKNSASEEVKRLAVQNNGFAIVHISNPSEALQKIAVQQNRRAIEYIDNPSEEVKRIAAANK